jgi:hypothetical protein
MIVVGPDGRSIILTFPVGYIPGLKHRQAWLHFDIDKLEDGRLTINPVAERSLP